MLCVCCRTNWTNPINFQTKSLLKTILPPKSKNTIFDVAMRLINENKLQIIIILNEQNINSNKNYTCAISYN